MTTTEWASTATLAQITTEIRVCRRAFRMAKENADLSAAREIQNDHDILMREYRIRIARGER